MTIKGDAYHAAHDYLVYGLMVGVFKVCGGDLDAYENTTGFDVIHFVNDVDNDLKDMSLCYCYWIWLGGLVPGVSKHIWTHVAGSFAGIWSAIYTLYD